MLEGLLVVGLYDARQICEPGRSPTAQYCHCKNRVSAGCIFQIACRKFNVEASAMSGQVRKHFMQLSKSLHYDHGKAAIDDEYSNLESQVLLAACMLNRHKMTAWAQRRLASNQ